MTDLDYRHSISITLAVRQSNSLDYYSTSVESTTLHFPMDTAPDDGDLHARITKDLGTVLERWKEKVTRQEAQRVIREASPQEVARAIEELRKR